MLLRMLKTLTLIGISVSVALTLLQAFLATKMAHADPAPTPTIIMLPAPQTDGAISLEKTLATRRSKRQWTNQSLSLAQIGQLCWAAQGISDPATGKRTAPSARALYPLQLYVVSAEGVFHYLPQGHRLEKIAPEDRRNALGDACGGEPQVKTAALSLVYMADFEKFEAAAGPGSRPMVYLEAGHSAQNVLLQAVALGLGAVPIGAARDPQLREALGLPNNLSAVYVVSAGHPR